MGDNGEEAGLLERCRTVLSRLDDGFVAEMLEVYRDLHRHPELSHQEERTSGLMADALEKSGYEVVTQVGGHGVVGLLRNGEGPVVMLRADMDALPVRELTGLPYASEQISVDSQGEPVPVAHACGHDIHMTGMLGAAALLARGRDAWQGTVMAVAQPAEEVGEGAVAMLQAGLFEHIAKPDVALAQHVVPLPAGMIGHRAGPMMSASAVVTVTIFGRGGHSSAPQATVDPVVIAAHVITRLQTIVSREVDPAVSAVVSVGVVKAGTVANVIPDQVELGISVRSSDNVLHHQLLAAIKRIVEAEAEAGGATTVPDIKVSNSVPVNDNDHEQTAIVRAAHQEYFESERVAEMPALAASEDFPYFGAAGAGVHYNGAAVPTVYWTIGGTAMATWVEAPGDTPQEKIKHLPVNHSALFSPDPVPTLHTASAALVVAALARLKM